MKLVMWKSIFLWLKITDLLIRKKKVTERDIGQYSRESEALNILKGKFSIYLIIMTKHVFIRVSGFIHFSSQFLSHSWMIAWRKEETLWQKVEYMTKKQFKGWFCETAATKHYAIRPLYKYFFESIFNEVSL